MSVSIVGNFLTEAADFFDSLPDVAEQAAMMAINQVSEREAVPMIRKEIESQVAFPPGYLALEGRLGVTRKATLGNLEAVITGRDRPTSLARFAFGQTPENSRGKPITVAVKKGRARRMGKVFLIRLRNGNIGLATRDEKVFARAYDPYEIAPGLYLLYGPSVDQVMKSVADDSLTPIGTKLSREFLRQFARLSSG